MPKTNANTSKTTSYRNMVKVLSHFGIDLTNVLEETLNHMLSGSTSSGNLSSGNITNDSRAIKAGDIFCAIIGFAQDGRQYNQIAVDNGAVVVIAQCEIQADHGKVSYLTNAQKIKVPVVSFYQLNTALFTLSKLYYGSPQSKMSMIGITGTNGKTSTSQLLGQLLSSCNKPCAVIGTNGYGKVDALTPLNNTTPSAPNLHQYFTEFVDDGVACVAMEASSHALEQGRVYGDLFDIALFTNLSRDHLDYHGNMADYAAAKKRLFTGSSSQIAVLNGDDEQAKMWLQSWPAQQAVWLFGKKESTKNYLYHVQASDIIHHHQGVSFMLHTHLGNIAINSPLLGDFNVDNLLAAIAVLMIQNISLKTIAEKIKAIKPIAGRMESTSLVGVTTTVVDYAHTPDALEKALLACKQHCQGKLWAVFGCGGDRDKGKRPLMAQAAEKVADYLVITNDNPRTEDPQSIVDDMLCGLPEESKKNVTVILDREKAVLSVLNKAKPEDIVLLAGKGHEDYIIIGTEIIAYNERALVADFYQSKVKRVAT